MFKLALEKAEEPGIKLQTSTGLLKKQEFQKNIYFCFIDYAKTFACVDHNKLWKIWRRWKYQAIWPASWEICMQVKKQQLELDMKQQTGFRSGKEYIKAVYCHPAYLTYMQSTSYKLDEAQAGIKTVGKNINTQITDTQITPPLQQKVKRN